MGQRSVERHQQTMSALAMANVVRLARAKLRRDIKAGAVSAVGVVQDPPACASGMTVMQLLTSQDYWGRSRAHKLLNAIGLAEARALGDLTDRQRHVLVKALHEGAHIGTAYGRRKYIRRNHDQGSNQVG